MTAHQANSSQEPTEARSAECLGKAMAFRVTGVSANVRPPRGAIVANDLSLRVKTVATALGSNTNLASILAVSKSQPARWISGQGHPNPEKARIIVDLDHVIARASLVWVPEVIPSWLHGHNSFLGGARPIDVLITQGVAPVLEALDQELVGAYA
ncbi:hypothetical protein [Glutamicibacter protophormiae]|uniref:hypothetical protein n=1 Tax=Glutamicibacter protophormiae TaxID=37930 RepID=UPI003A8F6034